MGTVPIQAALQRFLSKRTGVGDINLTTFASSVLASRA